jgi:hypothetical protein
MELKDAILSLSNLQDHTFIYVPEGDAELNATTPVMLAGYEVPRPAGWRYFLEIPTAREVLEVWSSWRDNRVPSTDEACDAIIYYADHDAYIIDDLEAE